jgi:hypothetical protein
MQVLLRALLLIMGWATLVGAGERAPSSPPRHRMERVYIFETVTAGAAPESIIVIGNRGFRSVAALKQFIAGLPRGAVLEWEPGCIRFEGELLSSVEELDDLKAACKERGVELIVHMSG